MGMLTGNSNEDSTPGKLASAVMFQQAQAAVSSLTNQQLEITALLQTLVANGPTGIQTLAATDAEIGGENVAYDFPVSGAERRFIQRQPGGGTFAVSEAGGLILLENNRRLGGAIVNPGENEVILVLGSVDRINSPGVGSITLGERQSWNMMLGPFLWCGNVSAKTAAGKAGSLSVVEV